MGAWRDPTLEEVVVKIVEVTTRTVELALRRPIGTALHAMESIGCVVVEVRTDDGVVGGGHLFTLNGDRLGAFDEMVRGLADAFVVGRDPHDTGAIWADVWKAVNPTGHAGVTIAALSALDVACWDAVGRAHETPLHKLFGAVRSELDTYASSGLWLSDPIDHLQAEAQRFVEQGFRAMKIRVGSSDTGADVERVRAVRDVIGPEVGLLADANQAFRAPEAIRLGRRLEEFDLVWLEEPCATHDLDGHRRVRDRLDVAIATGETEYTRYGLQRMIDAGAADVLMPDLQRIGGYTEFRRAAAAAAAVDLPVSSHFFTEQSLAVMAATENATFVEHVDWFAPLFEEEVELVGGRLVVPDRPGTGFTYRG